jgi:hypothetical protein
MVIVAAGENDRMCGWLISLVESVAGVSHLPAREKL